MTRPSVASRVARAAAAIGAASIEAPGASEFASGDRAFVDGAAHGARFDAKCMEHQASDPRKVIAAFEREARDGRDARTGM